MPDRSVFSFGRAKCHRVGVAIGLAPASLPSILRGFLDPEGLRTEGRD